jgi:DNA invertase Pin-like site-specific DNA recombinase
MSSPYAAIVNPRRRLVNLGILGIAPGQKWVYNPDMPAKPKIPKAEHKAILLLRKSGRSVQDIARMYGVTRQAIYKIIWASS